MEKCNSIVGIKFQQGETPGMMRNLKDIQNCCALKKMFLGKLEKNLAKTSGTIAKKQWDML